MKGYCGHITHLSVVSDFDILIFCLFISFLVCLYIVLCWFCKRNMVQSFWRTITFCIFVKTIHFQHQQGWGSQKYFWCLDLFTCKFIQKRFLNSSPKIFSLNFECYFSLSVKKCLPLWARPLGEGPATKSDKFLEKIQTCLLQSVSCCDFSQYNFWKKTYPEPWFYSVCVNFMLKKPCLKFPKSAS